MHSFAGGGARAAGQTMAATTSAETYRARRLGMVNSQLRTGRRRRPGSACRLPRARRASAFVSPSFAELAYLDRDAPALGAKSRRCCRPLDARPHAAGGRRHAGRAGRSTSAAGSGYGAAILAAMGAKVVALKSDPGAAARRARAAVRPGERDGRAWAARFGRKSARSVRRDRRRGRLPGSARTRCSRFLPTAGGWSELTRPWAPRKRRFTNGGAKR